MIPWWWLPVSLVLGVWFGFGLMALLVSARRADDQSAFMAGWRYRVHQEKRERGDLRDLLRSASVATTELVTTEYEDTAWAFAERHQIAEQILEATVGAARDDPEWTAGQLVERSSCMTTESPSTGRDE